MAIPGKKQKKKEQENLEEGSLAETDMGKTEKRPPNTWQIKQGRKPAQWKGRCKKEKKSAHNWLNMSREKRIPNNNKG